MKKMNQDANYIIRDYRPTDEEEVIGLLRDSLQGVPPCQRNTEFWQWKHFINPFGRSYLLIACYDKVIGLRAFMKWQFKLNGQILDLD